MSNRLNHHLYVHRPSGRTRAIAFWMVVFAGFVWIADSVLSSLSAVGDVFAVLYFTVSLWFAFQIGAKGRSRIEVELQQKYASERAVNEQLVADITPEDFLEREA